jgi:tRNA-specific 2-thiouridylase
LAQIPQQSLRKAIFPVGGFTKDIVKKLATANGFADIAQKKESMGICFIGKLYKLHKKESRILSNINIR